MQKIFSTAEIEKSANENHLQTFEVLDQDDEPIEWKFRKIPRPIMPTIYLYSKKRKKKCRGSVWKRLTNTLNISTFKNACKSTAKVKGYGDVNLVKKTIIWYNL